MAKSKHPIFRNFIMAYAFCALVAMGFVASSTIDSLMSPELRPMLVKQSAALFLLYLCGSIPFGLIFTRIMTNKDVRNIGSGNIGTTNVLRSGNKLAALLTLLFDISKGYIPLFLLDRYGAGTFHYSVYYFAFLFPVLGHMFPCWLGFKGGKGIATGLGVMLFFVWPVALVSLATWVLLAKFLRISSLAGLVSFTVAPLLTTYLLSFSDSLWMFFLSALVFLAHRDNIGRLLSGQESKIGESSL